MRPAVNRQTVTAAIPMSASSEIKSVMSESKSVPSRTDRGSKKSYAELLSEFLEGMYDTKPIDRVSADTGIAWGTVKKYVEGRATPNLPHCLRFVAAYGPEYLVAVLPNAPKWLRQAHRDQQEEKLLAQRDAINRRLGMLP